MDKKKMTQELELREGEVSRFYDPLYQIVVFTPESGSRTDYWEILMAGGVTGGAKFHFQDLMNSAEMSRLNFLRQTGLAWLVYPSATHTRFAHSLGCWVLGQKAKDNVWVQSSTEGLVQRLDDWLNDKGLANEFMLSLLFHDLGHFPFSHIIENNDEFQDISHEAVTCQLLKGEGATFGFFEKYFETLESPRVGGPQLVSQALKGIDADIGIVCSLISLDFGHLQSKKAKQHENDVKLLAQLVSGVIDLDRLDHYRRDSYFIGVRVGEFNVDTLLNEMTIAAFESEGLQGGKIVLLDDGILQAFAVLFSKDQLVRNVFNHPKNVAYEAMLNHCVAMFLKVDPSFQKHQILALTDDELFNTLLRNPDPDSRDIMSRIRNRQPFPLVGRYYVRSPEYLTRAKLIELRQEILSDVSVGATKLKESDVLFRIPGKFGRDVPRGTHDWMNLSRIVNSKNQSLRTAEDYGEFVRYLEKAEETENSLFCAFASTNEVVQAVDKHLRDKKFLRKIG